MFQVVEGRHGRGQVVLGKDITCGEAEHRGWGTGCESLTLNSDGLYGCGECGLLYKKPKRYTKLETTEPSTECDCTVLTEFIDSYFDECHGYDCPILRYNCTVCGRYYKAPNTAKLDKQTSEAGKKHVASWNKFLQHEHEEKLKHIQDDVAELVQKLKEVSPEERAVLLKPLFS